MNLGDTYKDLGNYTKAKELLEKTLIAYEKYFGKNHIETARVINSLGQLFLFEGNLEAAENLFKRASDIFKQNKHPDVYIVFEEFAQLYQKKAEQAKKAGDSAQTATFKNQAIGYLNQALKIVKAHFPQGVPLTS